MKIVKLIKKLGRPIGRPIRLKLLINKINSDPGCKLWYHKEFPECTGWIKHFYNAGFKSDFKVIFDVGANIGVVSKAAVCYFPDAQIYCFEPCSSTFKELEKNLSPFKSHVKLYNWGFYNVTKEIPMNIASFHGANTILDLHPDYHEVTHIAHEGKELIRVERMDDFVARNNIENIDLLKIDVEGVDKEVLEGAYKTLKDKVENIIEICFIYKGRDSKAEIEVFNLLYECGFVLVDIIRISRQKIHNRCETSTIDCLFSKRR